LIEFMFCFDKIIIILLLLILSRAGVTSS